MTPERLARVAATLTRVTPCTPSRLIFIPFGDCRRPVIPDLIVRANSSARPPRFSRTVHGRFITYIIMCTLLVLHRVHVNRNLLAVTVFALFTAGRVYGNRLDPRVSRTLWRMLSMELFFSHIFFWEQVESPSKNACRSRITSEHTPWYTQTLRAIYYLIEFVRVRE